MREITVGCNQMNDGFPSNSNADNDNNTDISMVSVCRTIQVDEGGSGRVWMEWVCLEWMNV